MNRQELLTYLSAKFGAVDSYPFGPDTRVFKVGGKIFAILAEADEPLRINLKCDPDEATALRDVFESVIPGYHMNKKHWNTVIMEGDVPGGEVERMIDNSYILVVQSLTKAQRASLAV